MRVCGKIGRKVSLDVPSVVLECDAQVTLKRSRNHIAAFEQIPDPEPRKAPESDFQAASPIDPIRVRILFLPLIPLAKQFFGVSDVTGETICLGECDQMLMSVQFPCNFVIANAREIQIWD